MIHGDSSHLISAGNYLMLNFAEEPIGMSAPLDFIK